MIDTMYVLRPHGSSSYVTNLNLSFQIAGLSNGENRKSVGFFLAELQWLVEKHQIINVLR